MTLTSSGSISQANVNVELGLGSTTTISLNQTNVRTLAGKASGTISMSDLLGKSNAPSFSPDGGASSGARVELYDYGTADDVVSITIECSVSAVWNYTRSGTYGTPTTGSSTGTSRSFTLTNGTASFRGTTWTVSATAGGVTKYWRVQIDHDGYT